MQHIFKNIPLCIAGMSVTLPSAMASGSDKPDNRPNILIFIADDISQRDLGCYGNSTVRTPNIDALARDGVKFNNAVLATSSSSPSRVSIITGRYPHNTGACELHSPVGDEQISLAGILKGRGYYTMQAGKWHFGNSAAKPSGPFAKNSCGNVRKADLSSHGLPLTMPTGTGTTTCRFRDTTPTVLK